MTRDEILRLLCPAELAVLCALVQGQSCQDVITRLHITAHQEQAIRASLMGKLGASQTADLVRTAITAGLE